MNQPRLSNFLIGNKLNDGNIGRFVSRRRGGNVPTPSSLKNVSNRQFLNSSALVKKYGLFGDADFDRKVNWKDCFPFDRKRQDVIIPAQLQAQRPQLPQSLYAYQQSKLPQQQIISGGLTQEQVSNIENTQKKMSRLSYEDYFNQYQNLPSYMKEFFTNPTEIKQSSEYQSYQSQKSEYESAQASVDAWNLALTYYNNNMAPQRSMGEAGSYLREFYTRENAAKEQMVENYNKFMRIQRELDAKNIAAEPFVPGAINNPVQAEIFGKPMYSSFSPVELKAALPKIEQYKNRPTNTFGFVNPNLKTKDTYDASSGFYSSVSPTGRQGTAYIRPPTTAEQQQLDLIKQKEQKFYGTLSTKANKFTAEGSGSSVWKSISNFGQMTTEELRKLGTQISESAMPKFRERRLEEESLASEGEQISLMVQEFQNKYQNVSSMIEGSPERLQYEAELNNLNLMVESHNQRLQNYTSTIEQAQEKPVAEVGGLLLFKGGGEYVRSFVKGAIETPFTISGMTIGLATDPVRELIGVGKGIKQLPEQVEKYPVSTFGYISGQVAMGSLISGGIKKLREPKYTTEVSGVTKYTEEGAVTDLLFKTKEQRLISSKDYSGSARATTTLLGEAEGVQVGRTVTTGKYSPIAYNLFSSKTKATKPTKFAGEGLSLSMEAPVEFTNPIDALYGAGYTKTGVTGYTAIDLGGVATKKGASYYAGTGGGIITETGTNIFGKTGLVDAGKVTGRGLLQILLLLLWVEEKRVLRHI
jgi:hypothetical protein